MAKEDAASTSTEVSSETLLSTILKKVNSLEEDVKDLKKENASLKGEIKALRNQTDEIDDNVYELEKDITRLDQYTRRWNIEIQNIPDDIKEEELKPAIVHALTQIDVDVQEDGIEAVHRLKKSKKSKGPAPVIVRFRKRDDAFTTMMNKRHTKKIQNDTFGPSMKTKIFIHENLGPRAKKIFDFCLQQQRDGHIYKVWTTKGVTHFLFENDKKETPTKVYHYGDLWNHFPDDD